MVEVSIHRLRAKIDDAFERKLIHTLRGVGYVLEEREEPASLSMRLGLSVALMGAALVVLPQAALAYFSLTHELASLARSSLNGKLEQIQHRLKKIRYQCRHRQATAWTARPCCRPRQPTTCHL